MHVGDVSRRNTSIFASCHEKKYPHHPDQRRSKTVIGFITIKIENSYNNLSEVKHDKRKLTGEQLLPCKNDELIFGEMEFGLEHAIDREVVTIVMNFMDSDFQLGEDIEEC